MDPNNYYYKNGRKYYEKNIRQSNGTYKDTVISKKNIEKILDQILEYDLARDVIKLTEEKKVLEEKKKKLFEEIGKLNIKIDDLNVSIKNTGGNYEEEIEKRNREINRGKNEFPKKTREKPPNSNNPNEAKEAKKPRITLKEIENAVNVLSENGILIFSEIPIVKGITIQNIERMKQTKKHYKEWLIKNHSDKGGDQEKCKEVIAAFTIYEKWYN
jgi:hypothetical protein